jgi:hypothetical protein
MADLSHLLELPRGSLLVFSGHEGKLPTDRAEQLATLVQSALGRLLPDAPWASS